MDIETLKKKPHLSVSSVNDYTECGLLYMLSRVHKVKPDFTPDSMAMGSAIHKALADFNRERTTGNIRDADYLQDVFEKHWSESARSDNIRYRDGDNSKTIINEGRRLLKAFSENFQDKHFRVLAVEEPFAFTIRDTDIPIIGVIDLIEEDESGTVIISDYKTSAKAYSAKDVDKNDQLTVYQMAGKNNGFRDREILLRFDCLIKTKTAKYEQYYTTRTESDEHRIRKKIIQVWEGIRKEVFIPNDQSWKCPGCSYKSYCNEWFEGGGRI